MNSFLNHLIKTSMQWPLEGWEAELAESLKVTPNEKHPEGMVYWEATKRRLLHKTQKTDGGCWLWSGSKDTGGYGMMAISGKGIKCHRISWMIFNGEIPEKTMVLHKCDVRNCVNPDHLFLGTQDDNMKDCKAKGRIRNCPQHGETNPMAKLTKEQVTQMRKLREETGLFYNQIAKQFNISTMTAHRAITGKLWKTV